MEMVRTDSKFSGRTDSPSNKRCGEDTSLATPKWTGQYSFAWVIYLMLHNRRLLHSRQNRMEEARKEFKEALKINRELAQKNPETYLPEAMTLNNRPAPHCQQNRMEEAWQEFKEALKINRELGQKNSETYLPEAMTLNNRPAPHCQQNRMEEAWKEFKEALKINRELAQKNRQETRPGLT